MHNTIVIIGSGLSGYLSLRALRTVGIENPIVVLSQENGDFYSKPLLSAGFAQGKTADELVSMTAEQMAVKYQATIKPHCTVSRIVTDEQIAQTAADERIGYQYLILACGASPIDLALSGNGSVQSINHLSDYRALRQRLHKKQRVVILGAGLVGTEFACDLAKDGHHIEVVHDQHYPVNQLLPEAIGQVLQQAITDQLAVRWHMHDPAVSVEKTEMGMCVRLRSGQILDADIVLSAVGLRPNVQLAKVAGLSVGRGIRVDRTCRTSQANVFALGDCAEVDEHVAFFVPRLRECAEVIAAQIQGDNKTVVYPPLAVMLKTPPCRVMVCPPPPVEGKWQVTGKGGDLEAVYYDISGHPVGCAFSGNAMVKRPEWMAKMPGVFDN